MKTLQRRACITSAAAVLSATAIILGAGTGSAISAPVLVDTSPYQNKHWSAVFTNEISLRWDWNAAATHAKLAITGMNGSFTTNFLTETSIYVWRAFTEDTPDGEDVHDLTLTFYDGAGTVGTPLTARLALVKGAFGETAVDSGPSDRAWTTVRENVVIPYDAAWSNATAEATAGRLVITKEGGAAQTNTLADASGYFGWKLRNSGWERGTFELALTFPEAEGEWDATLVYVPGGTMILMQ